MSFNRIIEIENTLRDFILYQLRKKYNGDWQKYYGISVDRIKKWEEKRDIALKKSLKTGIVESRLIYYSDFYDLSTIISKNWAALFKSVFEDKKEFDVYFKKMEEYRNTLAHGRLLLLHQSNLLEGICGEIRNKIIRYQSKMEYNVDIFPRIERVADNFGNVWPGFNSLHPKTTLFPGDILEITINATDPEDQPLEFRIQNTTPWQRENTIKLFIENKHVCLRKVFNVLMRSTRPYHSQVDRDGEVHLSYVILPKKAQEIK
ncbi:Swt1 family HEPN domain-containing protein [Aquimarina celericrescens]|uniref:Swt1 family HEPN domain-containing protein n=1 Tax=Aquimarina celericrescens TaxID=1964542 RepID=A0ABW5AW75_9FLAO|nr:hypothetical protein [Aquimarina celericrescens]